MPRPVILFTNAWADTPLDDLAPRAEEWGYAGLELATWGDHFEVQRAESEADYVSGRLDRLAGHNLTVPVLGAFRVGTAVCDPIDARHKAILPDYVWGDGRPDGVRQRAAAEMAALFRAAQKLGAAVVSGFAGSPLWSYVAGWPAPSPDVVNAAFRDFVRAWTPLLDVCRDCGLKFALEVHPGQLAFDLHSAEVVLDALHGREEFGFTFDPSHFHWQGIDPVEFVRAVGDRIYHVHVKDAALTLDGRSGILNGYLGPADPRRGWQFRVPGRGGIDWEGVVRALNDAGYAGPLSVEHGDRGVDRDFGAAARRASSSSGSTSTPRPDRRSNEKGKPGIERGQRGSRRNARTRPKSSTGQERQSRKMSRRWFLVFCLVRRGPRGPRRPRSIPDLTPTGVASVPFVNLAAMDELKRLWTDRLVTVRPERPELTRFAGRVGRVVTVNSSGKAVVDFADGAWYDVPASEDYLVVLAADDPLRAKYDGSRNSAQAHPERGG